MGFAKATKPAAVIKEEPEDVVDPLQEQRLEQQRSSGRLSTILSQGKGLLKLDEKSKL